MIIPPRPHIAQLAECPHGVVNAEELAELGLAPEEVIDFSVSSNPFGPPPGLGHALAHVDVSRYPDPEATELREALARHLGLSSTCILVGNGSVELIWLLALAYLDPGDRVLIVGPTFGEYERACHIVGAEISFQVTQPERGFELDVDAVCADIARERPKLVFLCNPNNPTGLYLRRNELERLLAACRTSLLVIDEAYLAFVPDVEPTVDLVRAGNILLLRSMTKDYALAGLRLGYGLAHHRIIDSLRRVRPPWSTSALAQAAGLAALREDAHMERSRRGVWEAKAFLSRELSAQGLTVYSSSANFFLVQVADAPTFRRALLRRGCCVRDCTSFGLPSFMRIGVRTLAECQRLVEAVEEVLRHG